MKVASTIGPITIIRIKISCQRPLRRSGVSDVLGGFMTAPMGLLLFVMPSEVEVKRQQRHGHGEPLHSVGQVFFRAHGDHRPAGFVGTGARFGTQQWLAMAMALLALYL